MESILEAINNEILSLEPCVQRDNLITYCNRLYMEWENSQEYNNENERLQNENETLKKLLSEKLSYEDKIYIHIKYGVEV